MDGYILTMLAAGVMVLLVAWLPLLLERQPLSLPILCVLAGWAIFTLVPVDWATTPWTIPHVVERVAELVVIVALMGAGLKLDRRLGLASWRLTWRLLGVTMPLSIIGIILISMLLLGVPFATALLFAAALSPTDPVLASDVQVGPPRSGEEDEVRFALTSEAGLNDALAFPFVNLALVFAMADNGLGHWFLVDLLWKLAAGVVAGILVGKMLGWGIFRLPGGSRLSETGDGFVALGATLLSYALTELAHGYGFLAVFVTALVLRETERNHDFHEKLHHFMEQTERLLMMVVLVFLGGALARGLFLGLGAREVTAALLVLLVVRPIASWLGLLGSGTPRLERCLIAFFGIRGVGTVYYLAYALNRGHFEAPERLWALAGLIIVFSVLIHGTTATPLMRLLDERGHRSSQKA